MSFTKVEITGTVTDATGKLLNGYVNITPTSVMINGTETIEPAPIKSKITSGAVKVTVAANDDTGTLPNNSGYLFEFFTYRSAPIREFRAVVPHATGKATINELAEKAGNIGTTGLKPSLSLSATQPRGIIEALAALGLVTSTP